MHLHVALSSIAEDNAILYLIVVFGTGILTTILVPEDLMGISHFILTVIRRLLHIERER